MKFHINKKYISIGIVAFCVIALSIVFFMCAFNFAQFMETLNKLHLIFQPFIFGFVIAYLLNPIVNFFERKILIPATVKKTGDITTRQRKRFRAYSVILTILLIAFLIYFFVIAVAPDLSKSISRIILYYPQYADSFMDWVDSLWEKYPYISKNILSLFGNYSNNFNDFMSGTILPKAQEILKGATTGVYHAIKSIWNLVIGIIISVYVLFIKEKLSGQLKKIIYSVMSRVKANNLIKNTRFVSDTFIGFLSGKIFDSFIIGILCFIGCTILRFPYALLISVIIGVTNIIPFFGPIIGAIPSGLLVLMVTPKKCIPFIIFVIVLQQLDGNVIGPKILGDSTGISGLWVIFSILVFGGLWGPLGMIIGIPLFAVIYTFIKRKVEARLAARDLPTETEKYMTMKRIEPNGEFLQLAESTSEYFLNYTNDSYNDNKRRSVFSRIISKFKKKK